MNMYIHIDVAKTIMISNEVYNELKSRKGDRSFSEVIKENLYMKRVKTGRDLLPYAGILEGDKEYDLIMEENKKMWKAWTNKIDEKSA